MDNSRSLSATFVGDDVLDAYCHHQIGRQIPVPFVIAVGPRP
jgi:hypothetical protein